MFGQRSCRWWLGWLVVATAVMQGGSESSNQALKYFDPIALGLHPPLRAIRIYIYTAKDSPQLEALVSCNLQNSASSSGVAMESLVINKLSRSAFRTHDSYEADFFVVPARPACLLAAGTQRQALNEWYKEAVQSLPFFQISGGRNHIFVFTSSLGPLAFRDWYHFIHQSIFLMVQAQFDSLTTPPNTADLRQYPFQHYKDIIVPIQVEHERTSSLLRRAGDAARRFLLFVPSTPAASSLASLAEQEGVLVGNPFTADLTTATFCVVPRTGFGWTEAAYHAALAGCLPVLLTDALTELPFAYAIDWSKVSIKWPPDKADHRLLDYLRSIPDKPIQDAQLYLSNVRCSLQWEQPETECSPMAGILGQLLRKRRVFLHSPTTFWTLGSRPLNRSLAPLEAWRPPFVVEDVFLPMPKTCHGCREDAPPGTTTSCWQSGSYMHCKQGR